MVSVCFGSCSANANANAASKVGSKRVVIRLIYIILDVPLNLPMSSLYDNLAFDTSFFCWDFNKHQQTLIEPMAYGFNSTGQVRYLIG